MHTVRLPGLAILVFSIALVHSACAPAPNPTAAPGGASVAAGAPAPPERSLVMVTRVEPTSLASRAVSSTGFAPTGAIRLFNADLMIRDDRGVPQPYLVASLPQVDTDAWRVFPDGRMETTYTLRPGLTWHDGTPLTAADLVFAWKVYSSPEYGLAGTPPVSLIEEILDPDPRTVMIRWRQVYPDADAITGGRSGFAALPRHILGPVFEREAPEAFTTHPYWTSEFVGLGPYRLDRWEPGAFIEASAFDSHALGQPKISRLRLVWNSDPNMALAGVLAGDIHLTLDETLRFQQGLILKREWAARNAGTVLLSPVQLRFVQIQFRPEYANPRAILDLRVRQALAHAIDKPTLVEGLLEGEGFAAETMIAPQMAYFPAVERALHRYPYDVGRAEQLMAEAGYSKGSDAFFVSGTGERFTPELRAAAGGQEEQEQAVLLDSWRRAGVDARAAILPPAQQQDGQALSTFAAFNTSKSGLDENTLTGKLISSRIPSAANRWTPSNRGGWSNPEFDRLYDAFNSRLNRAERNQDMVQMMRIVSEEVPVLPLYYDFEVLAHTGALLGPQAQAPTGTRAWNVQDWHWR